LPVAMHCLFAGGSNDPQIQPCNPTFCNSRLRVPAVQVSLTPLAETKGRGAVHQNL